MLKHIKLIYSAGIWGIIVVVFGSGRKAGGGGRSSNSEMLWYMISYISLAYNNVSLIASLFGSARLWKHKVISKLFHKYTLKPKLSCSCQHIMLLSTLKRYGPCPKDLPVVQWQKKSNFKRETKAAMKTQKPRITYRAQWWQEYFLP